MSSYHLNPQTGETGKCRAKSKACPFGESAHYPTKEAARSAYEEQASLAEAQALKKSLKKSEKFAEELEILIALVQARLARREPENYKTVVEDYLASSYQLQKAVFPLSPGSQERKAAIVARDEGLRHLLAADIAYLRATEATSEELELAMRFRTRRVLEAHRALELALAKREETKQIAWELGLEPAEVEQVLRRALKEYNEPRQRSTSLADLAKESSFRSSAARGIRRGTGEQIARIMDIAVREERAI